MSAEITFSRLRHGSWGLKGPASELIEGRTVPVRRSDKTTQEVKVGRVIWTDEQISIAEIHRHKSTYSANAKRNPDLNHLRKALQTAIGILTSRGYKIIDPANLAPIMARASEFKRFTSFAMRERTDYILCGLLKECGYAVQRPREQPVSNVGTGLDEYLTTTTERHNE